MMKKFDVICIGQVVQDILTTNIPLDMLSDKSDAVRANSITFTTGGDAANEACILSRFGADVAFAGRVDKSSVGDMVYADLQAEGIDTSLIVRPVNCKTRTSIVLIHPDGDTHFIIGPGHNHTPEIEDIDFSIFEKTRAVSVGSLFGLGKFDQDGIDKVFEAAQAAGAITFADMTFDLDGLGPEGVAKTYPFIDYMMPSLKAAKHATGCTEPDEIADFFLAAGVKNVVLKLGENGCFFKNAEERFYVDPYKVDAIDTTGCGDNFTAAFIHARLNEMSHKECTRFANAAGALNSLGIGAHMYVSSEQQVLDFMETAEVRELNRK